MWIGQCAAEERRHGDTTGPIGARFPTAPRTGSVPAPNGPGHVPEIDTTFSLRLVGARFQPGGRHGLRAGAARPARSGWPFPARSPQPAIDDVEAAPPVIAPEPGRGCRGLGRCLYRPELA
jgi:hypothetical protein